jgi:hypothetical protein
MAILVKTIESDDEHREKIDNDAPTWAPPRVGVTVERCEPSELAIHGVRAGLLAGR